VGEIIPVIAELPSKGYPKMVWGVVRVLAVFAVRAVVAELAVIAFKAVKAVVAVIAEEAETAVVAVLAFPVRFPTKFVEVTDAKPDKLVYDPPKVAIVDPNVN
jgi:hypothetical protein